MGKPGKSKPVSSAGPSRAADKPKAQGKQDKELKPQKAGVKKQKSEEAVPAAGGAKPKKQTASEIDDIFGAKKKAPPSAADTKDTDKDSKSKRPKILGTKDDLFGEEVGKNRKKTEEGWNIYTEDELGLNVQGGDTDLCPFDCNCCF